VTEEEELRREEQRIAAGLLVRHGVEDDDTLADSHLLGRRLGQSLEDDQS
jgi:hypothetical protein